MLIVKKKIQKMVFPEGIVVDTTYRTYLTSNVNSLFLAKSQFMRSSEGIKEKLPIKNDEESSIVDKRFELSNYNLIKDMEKIIRLEEVLTIIR